MPSNPHAWQLADLADVATNGLRVFSTFACGGGSSMGYKLAGWDVVGANDIDPVMRRHYELNLHPRIYVEGPVRDLVTAELPDELFDLDLLDGSPPCSSFSIAGSREKAWGREKRFREGQAVQVLDDLFFDFLDVADRLRPRVVIAENVEGMLAGNARGYVRLIFARLRAAGYRPQLFRVNAAEHGVPQARVRVFFVAARTDLDVPPLTLPPALPLIGAAEACAGLRLTRAERAACQPNQLDRKLWPLTAPGRNYAAAWAELNPQRKASYWNWTRLAADRPAPTMTATDVLRHWSELRGLSFREWKRLGSFPDDYAAESEAIGKYMVGMSVPPRLMARLARAVAHQWFGVGRGEG